MRVRLTLSTAVFGAATLAVTAASLGPAEAFFFPILPVPVFQNHPVEGRQGRSPIDNKWRDDTARPVKRSKTPGRGTATRRSRAPPPASEQGRPRNPRPKPVQAMTPISRREVGTSSMSRRPARVAGAPASPSDQARVAGAPASPHNMQTPAAARARPYKRQAPLAAPRVSARKRQAPAPRRS